MQLGGQSRSIVPLSTFRNDQRSRPVFSPVGDIEPAAGIVHAAEFFKTQVTAALIGQYGLFLSYGFKP